MADTRTDVLVAVYQDLDEATSNFDALMQIVKDSRSTSKGRSSSRTTSPGGGAGVHVAAVL